MKQIIDGKIFDTHAASEVCTLPNTGAFWGDSHFHETKLYRTKKGRFFLAGRGGASSMWAQAQGNTRGPGEVLEPLFLAEQPSKQSTFSCQCQRHRRLCPL
jgi:hypothetical protein